MTTTPLEQRLSTRTAEVGGIPIARAIPQRALRKVGAWCFLDHAGPAEPEPPGMQVGPHPHIGLQTFTWMLEGEMLHRDSLGSEQIIRPGQVNLMTAGHGIAHSEENLGARRIHAAQLWIALPDSHRNIAPAFAHHPQLPQQRWGDFIATALVGEVLGMQAPPKVYTPLMGLDLWCAPESAGKADTQAHATLPLRPDFEHAVMCLNGSLQAQSAPLDEHGLLYLPPGTDALQLQCTPGTRLLVIGGEPLQENLLLWWNFVARTGAEIAEAKAQWDMESTSDLSATPRRFGAPVASPLKPLQAPSLDGVRLQATSS